MTDQTRIYADEDSELVPRWLLAAVFGLVLCVLCIVGFAAVTDRPKEAQPKAGTVADEMQIIVRLGSGGAADVVTPEGQLVAHLPSGQGGFVSGVWRALQYERSRSGVATTEPVNLQRYTDGRVVLVDQKSDWQFHMSGFGADNIASFARLLDAQKGE